MVTDNNGSGSRKLKITREVSKKKMFTLGSSPQAFYIANGSNCTECISWSFIEMAGGGNQQILET